MRRALLATVISAILCTTAIACGGEEEEQDAGPVELTHGLTPEQAEEVLIKVGDTTVTVGEFAERLADQSPYLRARYNSPERRREFLDNLVRFELLANAAEERGYTKLPEVQRTRKQVMIQQMMKELFEDKIRLSDISEDEIKAYYEANQAEFNKPEQVRASHILIKNRAAAQRVLQNLLEDPNDVARFRDAVAEHSEDEVTKPSSGDLHFFEQPVDGEEFQGPPRAVAEAAFSIGRLGGIHPELVQTEQGFHIVKLTGRRAALRRTLEEARRPIQNRLWREKREKAIEDFVTELREAANVEVHQDALSKVQIQTSPSDGEPAVPEPPVTPNVQ